MSSSPPPPPSSSSPSLLESKSTSSSSFFLSQEDYILQKQDKIQQFQTIFEQSLQDINIVTTSSSAVVEDDEQQQKRRCIILSGGVDTSAILAAAQKLGIIFHAAITVVVTNDNNNNDDDTSSSFPSDFEYSKAVAKEYASTISNTHYIIQMTPFELVTQYLPMCTKALYTFDGMTLRNSLIIAAAFHKVQQLGNYSYVIVGDGADELLGGYSFMWGKDGIQDMDQDQQTLQLKEWIQKRNDMCNKWTFTTSTLANMYGLLSYSPYTQPKVKEWVLNHTTMIDCIGYRDIQLFYNQQYQNHKTGKLLLRHSYSTISSFRRKDPIEVGSGITMIGYDNYWIQYGGLQNEKDYQNEIQQIFNNYGITIQNKEHLINFRSFQKVFGSTQRTIITSNDKDDGTDGSVGAETGGGGSEEEEENGSSEGKRDSFLKPHPITKKGFLPIGQGCIGCCYDIEKDCTFCQICGTWPAQRIVL